MSATLACALFDASIGAALTPAFKKCRVHGYELSLSPTDSQIGRWAGFFGDQLLLGASGKSTSAPNLDAIDQAVTTRVSARVQRLDWVDCGRKAPLDLRSLVPVGTRLFFADANPSDTICSSLQKFAETLRPRRRLQRLECPAGGPLRSRLAPLSRRHVLVDDWARKQVEVGTLEDEGYTLIRLPDGESAANVIWVNSVEGEALLVPSYAEKLVQTLEANRLPVVVVETPQFPNGAALSDYILTASIQD
ncbi:MAG: hypothetical protein KDD69_16000 [Bdellovibrionales bacterium]|nr:hypothetical protein [Bdellovibrionales bacterium]